MPPAAADPVRTEQYLTGFDLRETADRARLDGNHSLERDLKHQEWRNMASSYIRSDLMGLDPLTNVTPDATFVSQDVAQSFIVPELADRKATVNQMAQEDPEVQAVTKAYNTQLDLWREKNKIPLGTYNQFAPPDSQQDILDAFEKHEMPEEIAQSILTGLNNFAARAKEVDPQYDIATDPRFSEIVKQMGLAADRYSEGAFLTGDPADPQGTSATGRTIRAAQMGAAETLGGLLGHAADGINQLGFLMTGNLDSDWYRAYQRDIEGQTFIDKDGNTVNTGRRVGWEGPYIALKMLQGMGADQVQREINKLHDGVAWDRSQVDQEGLEFYVNGLAGFGGAITGFLATGGGQLLQWGSKGAAMLLAGKAEHIGKLRAAMIPALGMGAGAAVHNVAVYGRTEDYGKLAVHGMLTGPFFALAGFLGKGMEKVLHRGKMPKRAADALAGMFEGFALTSAEVTDLNSTLWQAFKDPTTENIRNFSRTMLSNVLGMGAFKGLTGTTPFEVREMERLFGPEGGAQIRSRQQIADQARQSMEAPQGTQRERLQRVREQEEQAQQLEVERLGRDRPQMEKLEEEADIYAERPTIKGPILEVKTGRQSVPVAEEMARQNREEIARLREEIAQGGDKRAINRRILELTEEVREATEAARGEYTEWLSRGAPLEGEARSEFSEVVRTEKVEGAEPEPQMPVKGVVEHPSKQILEAKRGELQEPERMQEGELTEREQAQEAQQGFDPLEDPNFMERPLAERRALMERRSGIERRRLAERFDIERRGAEPRRGEQRRQEPTEAHAEADEKQAMVVQKTREGKPKSLDIERDVERTADVPFTRPTDFERRISEGLKSDPFVVPMRPMGSSKVSDKSLGWYNRRENLARFGNRKLPGIRAHEWSHAFDRDLRKKGLYPDLPPELQAQILKAAETYPGIMERPPAFQQSEGWAEFWARYVLDDPRLPSDVPELYDWANKFISQPKMAPYESVIADLQGIVRAEIEMGALARRRAAIRYEGDPKTKTEKQIEVPWAKRMWRLFDEAMLDPIAEWKRVEKEVFEREGIDPAELPMRVKPISLHDMTIMKAKRQAENFIKRETFDVQGVRTGKSFREIFKDMAPERRKDWVDFTVSLREIHDHKKGLETTLSREDNLYVIRHYQKLYPEFVEYVREMRRFGDRLLDYSEESGAITEQERAQIRKGNPIYITMLRAMHSQARRGRGKVGSGSGPSGIRSRRGGSEREIIDPWQGIEETVFQQILKANQAKIMNALYLQTRLIPGMGRVATVIPRDIKPRDILISEIQAKLAKIGESLGKKADVVKLAEAMEAIAGNDPEAAITFFFAETMPKGARPVIPFRPKFTEDILAEAGFSEAEIPRLMRESGKLVWLEIDGDVYNALMTMEAAPRLFDMLPPFIGEPLRTATEAVRFGATTFKAAFTLKNPFRDLQTRQLYTEVGSNKYAFFSGLGDLYRGAIESFSNDPQARQMRNLGLDATTFLGSGLAYEMSLRQDSAFKSVVRKTADVLGAPETFLRYREALEVAERARQEGKSEFEATHSGMLAGAEVTTNFPRTGYLARELRIIDPYFTSSLAGKRKFWRTLGGAEGKAKQHQAMLRGLTNIGGFSALLWLLYKDEKWYQDLPLDQRIMNWTFFIGDEMVRLPKPFEPGIIFGTGMEIMLSATRDFDERLAEEAALTLLRDHIVGYPFIPNLIKPSLEGSINRSFWRGGPIVPEWMRDLPPDEQFMPYTTETFKAIGRALNISPAVAEYVVDQYGGGLPVAIIRYIEEAMGMRESPTGGLIPGVGWFTAPTKHGRSRAVNEFYELHTELRRKKGRAPHEEASMTMLNSTATQLKNLRDQRDSGTIPKEEADERMFEIASRAIQAFEEMRR